MDFIRSIDADFKEYDDSGEPPILLSNVDDESVLLTRFSGLAVYN